MTNGPRQAPEGASVILLFDGVCHLCDATVQWIVARDRRERFHFAALQSIAARHLLDAHRAAALPDSLVLVDEAGVHVQSDAALRIAVHLGRPWSWLGVARVVPRVLRDAAYAWIARNRYRWFGRRELCVRPTPELRARFLDADEPIAAAAAAGR